MTSNRGYHPHLIRSEFIETDDSKEEQVVKLYGLAGEELKDVYRPQTYGLSAHAPKKSNGVLVSFGGERSLSMLLGGDLPSKRPHGLKEGEVKLYDVEGNVIFMALKNGISVSAAKGDVVVKSAEGKITINAEGDIEMKSAQGKVTIGAKGHIFVAPSDGNKVYLGLSSPGGAAVVTTLGPSPNVFAKA
jgi:phage gp45-like